MSNWHDRHRTFSDHEHERELRKHDTVPSRPTNAQIRAELDRLESELIEAAARSQTACKDAMNVIEKIMADLGAPMSKEQTDAKV